MRVRAIQVRQQCAHLKLPLDPESTEPSCPLCRDIKLTSYRAECGMTVSLPSSPFHRQKLGIMGQRGGRTLSPGGRSVRELDVQSSSDDMSDVAGENPTAGADNPGVQSVPEHGIQSSSENVGDAAGENPTARADNPEGPSPRTIFIRR